MPHWSSSDPPEVFSPPFFPLCPQIHGLFPTIEFAVAPSPSLPNPGDHETPLAHACLKSSDLTAAKRSSAAHSRSTPPRSDPLRLILIARPRSRISLRARAPDAPGPPISARVPWRWARSVSAPSPSVADAPSPPVSARPPAHAPSAADLISAVGFRSDG
jgi:hypothetical protein